MGQQLKIKVNQQLRELLLSQIHTNTHTDIPQGILDIIKSTENKSESKPTKNKSDNVNSQTKNDAEPYLLSVWEMRWLHDNLTGDTTLHELVAEADIVLPQPEVLPRNPELEKRVQRLRVQQMERDYRTMTKNVDSVRFNHPEDTIAYQMKQINRQLIAVIQFLVSVGAGFTFGFIGVELIVGELDFGFRLLLGVMCALVIALAEIYFLAKKLADDLVPPETADTKKPHQD